MITNRRTLLRGLVASPAIVAWDSLMPLRGMPLLLSNAVLNVMWEDAAKSVTEYKRVYIPQDVESVETWWRVNKTNYPAYTLATIKFDDQKKYLKHSFFSMHSLSPKMDLGWVSHDIELLSGRQIKAWAKWHSDGRMMSVTESNVPFKPSYHSLRRITEREYWIKPSYHQI